MSDARSHSTDEYLEAIYFLALPIGEYRPARGSTPAIASRVAEVLGISRAAVGDMLRRLEADGLITRVDGTLAFTELGMERAKHAVRKHRIIERFLTDFMGYGAAECHDHAEELDHAFSDEMIERINERLGAPERCPHGWPIDTTFEQRENAELVALADVPAGGKVDVVRLAEHDEDLLAWCYQEGFVPGAKVEIVDVAPAAGQRRVLVDGEPRAVADKAATAVYVRVP